MPDFFTSLTAGLITKTVKDPNAQPSTLATPITVGGVSKTTVEDALSALNSQDSTLLPKSGGTMSGAIAMGNNKITGLAGGTADADAATIGQVNDKIATSTGFFRGSFATKAALLAVQWQTSDPSAANYVTNNDYAYVEADETHNNEAWRYCYVAGTGEGTGWQPQYMINESPLSSAQIAALNSGATTTNINQISTNQTAIGTLSNLTTTEKGSLVGAINELDSDISGLDSSKMSYVANSTLGAKNLLQNIAETATENGVTFTVNNDGSVSVSGTASADTSFYISMNVKAKANVAYTASKSASTTENVKLVFEGSLSGTSIGTVAQLLPNETSKSVTFDFQTYDNVSCYIFVASGTVANSTIYPMLRLGVDTDATYQPYSMTNQQLTHEFNKSGSGAVPIGTVIFYAGLTAPGGYLVCNGATYNISDYSDLADFIQTNYGAKNYFGGNGTTTFAVPDWRGEFFRASGTNGHTGEGDGANVGVHQGGTQIPWYWAEFNSSSDLKFGTNFNQDSQYNTVTEVDKTVYSLQNRYRGSVSMSGTLYDDKIVAAKVRPTNTSLLVCIKAKTGGAVPSGGGGGGSTIQTATDTISTNATTVTVSYSGTLINSYASVGGERVMVNMSDNGSSVTFTVAEAPASEITCTVVYFTS